MYGHMYIYIPINFGRYACWNWHIHPVTSHPLRLRAGTCQHLQQYHVGTQNAMMDVSNFKRSSVIPQKWDTYIYIYVIHINYILSIDYHKSTKCRSYIYTCITKRYFYCFVYDPKEKLFQWLPADGKDLWTIDEKPWQSLPGVPVHRHHMATIENVLLQ